MPELNKTDYKLEVIVLKEGDVFVPYVPALDLTSIGDTLEEAHKNIAEAVSLFIEGCVEKGSLETVLQNCGWKMVGAGPRPRFTPPSIVENTHTQVALPV